MFGDVFIGFEKWFKQFFCPHSYRFVSKTNGHYDVYECKKCGRLKIERW